MVGEVEMGFWRGGEVVGELIGIGDCVLVLWDLEWRVLGKRIWYE